MHRNRKKRLIIYAKILIFISIILFGYGTYLSINLNSGPIDPIKEVKPIKEEENTIMITVSDGTEVVNEGGWYTTPSGEVINGQKNVDSKQTTPSTNNADSNNELRNQIQNKYNIKIVYGSETNGYIVKSGSTVISTVPMTDPNKINAQLHALDETLSLYPAGIFSEIKNGGIPLTVTLIDSYSDTTITGVTDSNYEYANISIAAMYSFGDSFYHESYHYIERYMFKNGANFNSWDSLNPTDFKWGTINGNLSYSNTFSADAYFVNNYAQTAATEDRASTFEYMMADSKASCLNSETPVWKKANYMAQMMRQVLSSVKKSSNVYWERFLY